MEYRTLDLLEDLLPQDRHMFRLADGTEIPFADPLDFDAAASAKMSNIQRRLLGVAQKVQSRPHDQQAIAKYDEIYNEFLALLLPDMPAEVATSLTLGQKVKIVTFWRSCHEGRGPK